MGTGWGGWGFGWGGFDLLHMLWWLLVIAGVIIFVKWLAASGRAPADRALDILKERYARGDIAREEFESRKRDLLA